MVNRATHEVWTAHEKTSMMWDNCSRHLQWGDGSWSVYVYPELELNRKGYYIRLVKPIQWENK